jgi:hypothetical protein
MEEIRDPIRDQDWYWVAATYKAVHVGVPRKRHLWERTVFLLRAPADCDRVFLWEKAERVARTKEREYVGGTGDTIRWTFQEIEAIHSLFDRDLDDGTEVYWELFHRVDKKPAGEGDSQG